MSDIYLSIVIPAFNESDRILSTLGRLTEHLRSQDLAWEIILADYGSTDDTVALTESWSTANLSPSGQSLKVLRLGHGGKGSAVRNGMLKAGGKLRLMYDADLAMFPEQIGNFLEKALVGYDIVIGSRNIAGSRRFDEPAIRHAMGRVFNWYVRSVAVSGINDTQCGYKCFTSEAAELLFRMQKLDGWCFDVEILFLAQRNSMKK